MGLDEIIIKNFKSIGDSDSTIRMSSNLISLVGKNEAGKSSVLDALALINAPVTKYIRGNTGLKFIANDTNRVTQISPSIELKYSFTKDEIDTYFAEISESTKDSFSGLGLLSQEFNILFDFNEPIGHEGILKQLLMASDKVEGYYDRFTKDKNGFRNQQADVINKTLLRIQNKEDFINLFFSLNFAVAKYSDSQKAMVAECKEYFNNLLTPLTTLIPDFRYIELSTIKEQYNASEYQKEINNPQSLLMKLFKHCDIDPNELNQIISQGGVPSQIRNVKTMNQKIKQFIDRFNKVSGIDDILVELQFERGLLRVYFDDCMTYGERSEGMKQAMNLYMSTDTDSNEQKYVFLIDEPDKSLHIRAQKELLNTFKTRCENGDYIIYSTHSPFMIDSTDLLGVKLVEKEDEITSISKDMTSVSPSHTSKMETLTPIYHAMDYRLSDNLAPVLNKLNIIVEGKWDKIYIETMLDFFNMIGEKRPCIICSVGASNIPNIAKILVSWGVDTRVVLDNDRQGRRSAYKELKKAGLESIACFVKDCDKGDKCKGGCVCDYEIEDIVFKNYEKQYNGIKEETAMKYRDDVSKDKSIVTEYTIKSFKRIFNVLRINIES